MAGRADHDVDGGDPADLDGSDGRTLAPQPRRAEPSAPDDAAERPGHERSRQSQQ
jgi:hypothetical protein